MSKICYKEIKKRLNEKSISDNYEYTENNPFFEIFHCNPWDHGYETYHGYNGTRRQFYYDMKDVMNFLFAYINYHKITKFIVTPWYNYDQFERNAKYYDNCADIYEEISNFLKKHNIRRKSRTGIELETKKNADVIEMIIEGAFRGMTTLCIFFEDNGVILEPNHHFGIRFWTKNYLHESSIVKNILKSHPNLQYYMLSDTE